MFDPRNQRFLSIRRIGLLLPLLACLWLPTRALGQERTGYILGDRQGLEMLVHIIGEVQKPGEYRVRDQTDLLELLSKAGGPTQFSRLNSVVIRRTVPRSTASMAEAPAQRAQILRVDLARVMRDQTANPPPVLQPGDVVLVPKNVWHRWKDFAGVARDVSVVASAYFLYLRATKD